jgi:malonate transporter and related proteins
MLPILNSIFPIFAVIALGSILRRLSFIDDGFMTTSDRLIYYIFFPALLFWKIGRPSGTSMVDWAMIAGVLSAVFVVFVLSLVFAWLARMPNVQVGSFSQACYRFSTYVGMAVVMTDMGESGVREFAVLIGFVIPFINVLAVSSLLWYGLETEARSGAGVLLLRSTVTNPLIIACVLGMLYSLLDTPLPGFINNCLQLMSLLALPLALISIGGCLTFRSLGRHFTYAGVGAVFKLVLMPFVGYVLLQAFGVKGQEFKVAMIYFALPTSPNNYILSALLNSDLELAASSIVLSTLLSLGALSVTLVLFS